MQRFTVKRKTKRAHGAWAGALSIAGLLAVGFFPADRPVRATTPGEPSAQNLLPQSWTPAPAPQWTPDPATLAAQGALASRIRSLGDNFSGDVGIAVKDLQTGWTADFDGSTYFPQQSVSKFWVALTAFAKADRGELSLATPVTMRASDITLFHQPIAAEIRKAGSLTTNLNALLERALQQSDNTCNDFVLWKTGGPDAVRAFLAANGIDGIRFGPGERMLQSGIAGMTWQASYAGRGFEAARSKVPATTRRAAFERYIADPIDGATPRGIVDALGKLNNGELLSRESTARMLGIMSHTRTGAQRLKGGLASGWSLAHKTGTGQVLGGEQAGYNDIGILTGPDGRSYAVAVLMRRTAAPLGQRMALMQNVTRAVIDYAGTASAPTMAAVSGNPKTAAN